MRRIKVFAAGAAPVLALAVALAPPLVARAAHQSPTTSEQSVAVPSRVAINRMATTRRPDQVIDTTAAATASGPLDAPDVSGQRLN